MFFNLFKALVALGKPIRAASVLTWRDGSIRTIRRAWKAPKLKKSGLQLSDIFLITCPFFMFKKKNRSYMASQANPSRGKSGVSQLKSGIW